MTVLLIIGVYLIGINLTGFIIMGIDKKRAKYQAWRIPEATLFAVSLFGGCMGSLLGMYTFRHKTQKPMFVIGMPAILTLHVLLIIILFLSPVYLKLM